MAHITLFSFVIVTVFAYMIYIGVGGGGSGRRRDDDGSNRGRSVYDDDLHITREPYGTYSFGNFFTTPQAQMPGYFEGTRVRCTDGCMYRTRNQGVSVDITCAQMCAPDSDASGSDSRNEQELNSEIIKSVNNGAIVYNHTN